MKIEHTKAIIYAGDIHGRTQALEKLIEVAQGFDEAVIVQVGDFGFGMPSGTLAAWVNENKRSPVQLITALGNHENYDKVQALVNSQTQPTPLVELYPESNIYFARRGAFVEIFGISHLFLGGAESTDKHHRKEGYSWWAAEEPSAEEIADFEAKFQELKPNTIITHDAPLRVKLYRKNRNQSLVPNALERIYTKSEHQPRRHYFGHHHLLEQWKVGSTKFYCCGLEGDYHLREVL